jgi:transcriptional regulator with XRE-family HTH domain
MDTSSPPRERARTQYLDSERLERALTESGITQAELAAAADVDPGHVSHWLAGDYGCGPEVITRLARAIPKCKPTDLMHKEGRGRYAELLEALKAA